MLRHEEWMDFKKKWEGESFNHRECNSFGHNIKVSDYLKDMFVMMLDIKERMDKIEDFVEEYERNI